SLSPALNPLRYDRESADSSVKYAGYTLHTTLQLSGPNPPPQVGLWHLVQLPHGGDMLVPTFFRSQPKVYMGTIGPEDLIVDDHVPVVGPPEGASRSEDRSQLWAFRGPATAIRSIARRLLSTEIG